MSTLGSRLYDRFDGRPTHAILFCTMIYLEAGVCGDGREAACRRWLSQQLLEVSRMMNPERPRDDVVRDLDATVSKADLRVMLRIIRYVDWQRKGCPTAEGRPLWLPWVGPVFLPPGFWGITLVLT